MARNSNLVDFERGSILGGLLTAVVFIGFTTLLVYDITYNISNKPYNFDVRDKFMSPEEHIATKINLGDYAKSSEHIIGLNTIHENGTTDYGFDPFDNDYVEFLVGYIDYDENQKEGRSVFY